MAAPEATLASPDSDADLARRVARHGGSTGDRDAEAELCRRFAPRIRLYGLKHLRSEERAADLVQSVLLVVIEALASGVPVAAYPVTGPIDILGREGRGAETDLPRPAGAVDADLSAAVARALNLSREDALALGKRFTWDAATDQFEAAIRDAFDAHYRKDQRDAA